MSAGNDGLGPDCRQHAGRWHRIDAGCGFLHAPILKLNGRAESLPGEHYRRRQG